MGSLGANGMHATLLHDQQKGCTQHQRQQQQQQQPG
jgi:hypothetical protein